MPNPTIVFRSEPRSDESSEMAARLREHGVTVLDEQANMLLVAGPAKPIKEVVGAAQGWSLTRDTTIPLPDTRQCVTKSPA